VRERFLDGVVEVLTAGDELTFARVAKAEQFLSSHLQPTA
jgi:hypothetical protein